MNPTSPLKRQPNSIFHNGLIFKTNPEIAICLNCPLPSSKCSDDCKRYKEELKKIKLENKKQKLKEGKTK